MDNYNFTDIEKLMIIEDDGTYILYKCQDHGVYMTYKNINSTHCPYCQKSHAPIQNIRELRKQFKKELNYAG